VLTCFIEGEHLDPANPPERIQTPEMQQVMSIVEQFSEKDRAYHTYQARQKLSPPAEEHRTAYPSH
jgi:hypothetical protein